LAPKFQLFFQDRSYSADTLKNHTHQEGISFMKLTVKHKLLCLAIIPALLFALIISGLASWMLQSSADQ